MQLQHFPWPYISQLPGWSRIRPDLQLQINALLDNLPDPLWNHEITVRRIGSWRLFVWLLPVFALLGWVMGAEAESTDPAWIGGACVFGAAFLLAVCRSYPQCLVLSARGIRFVCANHEITCPWALFAARGEPQSQTMTLLIPINPDLVSDVVLTRRGVVVARGLDVHVDYLKILDSNQVWVISNLEVSPQFLGLLLQEIGAALNEAGSAESFHPRQCQGRHANPLPLQTARDEQEHFSIVSRGTIQEITLPRTRLKFPPECCGCGQPTSEEGWIEACGKGVLSRSKRSVHFAIPCCRNCRQSETRRAWLGGILCSAAVVAGAASIAFATIGTPTRNWSSFLTVVGIVAVFPMKQALDFGSRMLLRTKATYVWESESIHLRLRQPGYARRIRDCLND